MKKEANRKNGKWLWLAIGLVVLLAVVGVVLALVFGGGQKDPADSTGGRPELYWNLDKADYLDAVTGMSTREKAEDGYYYIRFAYNGELLELPVADKQLVNYIDSMDIMGLVMDADDCVVDAKPVADIAIELETGAFIQRVDGDTVCINSSIAMNGMKKEVEITQLVEIYDVTADAEVPGQKLTADQLQIMDKVAIYANLQEQTTHVYVLSHATASKVYWRAEQFYSNKKTTRVPDESGVYSIDFFCDGERVTLKCKDEAIVTYIDKQSRYSSHFGFVFDEEGYIVEHIGSYEAIRGIVRSERFDVTGIEGNNISTTKVIGSNMGSTDAFTIDENCIIYDVSPTAKAEGRQGLPVESLQMGDRIVCFADAEGNPIMIYVAVRLAHVQWYRSADRQYDGTNKVTKRTPDAEGYYVYEVFSEGKTMTVKTKDKALATQMDSYSHQCFGLKLNGDIIEYVYEVESVFGYSAFGVGRYVTNIMGSILTCFKTSKPADPINGIMSADCKIYNLSAVGTFGEETKLQVGDYIYAYQNPNCEIVQIFVIRRKVDADIYYSLFRMYDSVNKVTKREPDADGWYVFDVAINGRRTTVKTRSKAMATKMDAISPAAMALVVGSDGVVYEAYEARYATGGYKRSSGYTVTAINADGTVETEYLSSGTKRTLTLAEGCEFYNVSQVYDTDRGEATKLRVGDIITAYTNMYDEAEVIFVRTREVDNLYWHVHRMYDDDNKVSTRQPDADGWYVYELVVNGEIKTVKTKDKAIADQVDYYGGAFGLNVVNGEIRCVTSPGGVKNVTATGLINYDVIEVNGKKVTFQYNVPGASKAGETKQITLASNVKIYDVSPNAEKFGAPATLQFGDRVRTYYSENDLHTYVFITYRNDRAEGVQSKCDVCGETVWWNPWRGGSFSSAGGHYYLVTDVESTDPCSTGRSTLPECEVTLDLNGNTFKRVDSRAFLVYENATLNVLDTVGGGTVTSVGSDEGIGGVVRVVGGTFNLYSGTLKLAEDHAAVRRAGVLYVTCGETDAKTPGTVNMYGGTITDGVATGRGGNILVYSGSTFNMYDGTVANGKVIAEYEDETYSGGNICSVADSIVNIYGGTITGGSAAANGGNIYAGSVGLTVTGGTITGGSAKDGGNIYGTSSVKLTGGTISNSTASSSGGNIYAGGGTWTIDGAAITGGVSTARGGNMYITSGAVVDLNSGSVTNGKSGDGNANGGGNICMISNSTLNINGGTVSGGVSANTAGNILAGSGTLNISGGKIAGGTAEETGANVYVYGGATDVTITGGTVEGVEIDAVKSLVLSGTPKLDDLTLNSGIIADVAGLKQGAQIVVNADGVFTKALENTDDYINYFTSGREGSTIYTEEAALAMAAGVKQVQCSHCSEIVNWKLWSGTGVNGHYYLGSDTGSLQTATVEIPEGNALVLDLNGQTYTTSGIHVLEVDGGALTLMDSVGGGKIITTGKESTGNTYGAAVRLNGGTFNMVGGTLTMAADHNDVYRGGLIYACEGAIVNFTGGTITGGTSTNRGGNVYITSSTFNMSGSAVLENGTAGTDGGNLSSVSNSTVNITGGTVSGGSLHLGSGTYAISDADIRSDINVKSGAVVTVSGGPKLANLDIDSGLTVNLGELTADADITVTATGTFTEANENAQSYADAGYIKLANTALTLLVEENKLVASSLPVGAKQAACPHCDGADAIWYQWDGVSTDMIHYYLAAGVDTDSQFTVAEGTQIVLDLCGNTWSVTGHRAFLVNGTLSIVDSGENGLVTATGENGAAGVVSVGSSGAVNLYGGTLAHKVDENYVVTDGGVARVTGSFTMYGGTVKGGSCNRGGAFYLTGSAVFTMYDGSVLDGTASNTANAGGNIRGTGTTTINIYGGTVSGGTATAGTSGNIYAGGTLNISGGKVVGGSAQKQGDDIYAVGTTTVSGAIEIGIDLADGAKLTLGQLDAGAKIAVCANGVFTEESDDAEAYFNAGYFIAPARHEITVVGKTLSMRYVAAGYCEHCKQENVTWTAWDGSATAGHYYLSADVERTGQLTIADGEELVLDLNGKTWSVTGHRAFLINGMLSVLDSVGSGNVTATGENNKNGGVLSVGSAGKLSIYGGTVSQNIDDAYTVKDGGVIYTNAGEIVMYGGTLKGGNCNRGGNVYMTGDASFTIYDGFVLDGVASNAANAAGNIRGTGTTTINIYGGTVSGGVATAGNAGNIYAGGVLNITGGKVIGGSAALLGDDIYAAGTVAISNAPEIGIQLADGKTMTVGALTEGARITVDAAATAAITASNETIQTYLEAGYFEPASADITLAVENNKLIATVASQENESASLSLFAFARWVFSRL